MLLVPLAIVEKPLCLDSADFRAIEALGRRTKTKFVVNHQLRFHPKVRELVTERIRRVAQETAAAAGATVDVEFEPDPYPPVVNDRELAARTVKSLARVAGADKVKVIPYVTGAEDFAFFARHAPSFFWFVGSTPKGQDAATAPSNHSPQFFVDEAAIALGTRTMLTVAVDYLEGR